MIGTPCGPKAVGELGEPGIQPDELCPVSHHWEPDGNGGFVAVLDAPVDEAAAPAEEAPAEETVSPRRRKRMVDTLEPVAAAEGPADEEAESE